MRLRHRSTRGCCREVTLGGLLVVILCGSGVAASSGDEIHIEEIEFQLAGDWLVISAKCRGLFSQEAISTIESGLTAAVYVDVRLLHVGRTKSLFSGGGHTYRTVSGTELASSISYSIWDERYLVSSGGETAAYAELDRAVEAIGRVDHRVPVRQLRPMTSHVAKVRVRVVPISTEEGGQAADWLRNPARLEEDPGAEAQSMGIQLDVGRLISVFGGGKKKARNRSGWYTSKPFRIGDSGELLK